MAMSFDPREHLLTVSAACAVLLACALGAGAGLTKLAEAPNAKAREAALLRSIDALKRRERDHADQTVLARGVLCRGDLAAAEESLRQRLQMAVAQSGGTLASALTASEPPRLSVPNLSAVAFELEANGPYDALVQSLAVLAKSEPTIFTRRLDLTATPGGANLKLKGEVLCWTSA